MVLRYFLNDVGIVPVAPFYYWYNFCFYITIIIIKIADNITGIALLELCSIGCSEVTIKGLNDEWATYVL
jgi:hypothetical protein